MYPLENKQANNGVSSGSFVKNQIPCIKFVLNINNQGSISTAKKFLNDKCNKKFSKN